jgi:hypothetical protein
MDILNSIPPITTYIIIPVVIVVLFYVTWRQSKTNLTVVKITTPPQGGDVEWEETVIGSVWPKNSFVQVFVESANGRWYPKEAHVDGTKWDVRHNIGSQDAARTEYKLVAISGIRKVEESVPSLPEGGTRSSEVIVRRKKKET